MSCPPPAAARRAAVQQRGLTLIELLIALAIFALIGTLTWQASSQLILSKDRLESEHERWREIERALLIVENTLMQAVAPATIQGHGNRAPALVWHTDGGQNRLEVLSLTARAAPRRTHFVLQGDTLYWRRHPESFARAQPPREESDPLLTHLRAVRWRFWNPQTGWQDRWPPPQNETLLVSLPTAIRIELEFTDLGNLTRTYALR